MIWNTDSDRKSLWPLWHSPLEVAELYQAAVHSKLERFADQKAVIL